MIPRKSEDDNEAVLHGIDMPTATPKPRNPVGTFNSGIRDQHCPSVGYRWAETAGVIGREDVTLSWSPVSV